MFECLTDEVLRDLIALTDLGVMSSEELCDRYPGLRTPEMEQTISRYRRLYRHLKGEERNRRHLPVRRRDNPFPETTEG